jgi:hypothetical protein
MTMCRYRTITTIMLLWLMLSGCHIKLVMPEADGMPTRETKDLSRFKFSYSVSNLDGNAFRRDTEAALLAVFKARGITDVVKSQKFEQDRINIVVYELQSQQTDLSRYIDLPVSLIALGTLFLVPYYYESEHPVEIHLINPAREQDKQITIIRTGYQLKILGWLPHLFRLGNEASTGDDEAYSFAPGGKASVKVRNTGLRRILEQVIDQAVRD